MSRLLLYHHLLIFFFIFIAVSAQTSNNPICSPELCGNVNISYPFWKTSNEPTAQFCGYRGFGINCSVNGDRNVSEITLDGRSYYVKEINYVEYGGFILLADYDVSEVAPNRNSCPRVRHNTTIGTLPLNFTTYSVNLSFHFDCNGCPSFATEIPCLEQTSGRKSCLEILNTTRDESVYWDEPYSCADEVVITPVSREYIDRVGSLATNFNRVLENGFALQWETMEMDDACEKCEESGGWCGGDSPARFICFCSDGTTDRVDCNKGSKSNLITKLVVGLVSALLSFMILFIIFLILKPSSSNCVASLKHKTEDDKNVEAFIEKYGSLSTKRYKYKDIKKITNSFRVKLGQGGFGQVFKGKLSDGRLVAVKVLNSSKANGQEFINEVASIGRTSHVNIVTLLGFCFEYEKRALVYEYMPNGSLEKFINSHVHMGTNEHIGVKKLYEIALGIACGLDYLHRGCNTRILHLDIKPHNILLDEDFCPKIADFGLAKLYSRKESIVSMLEARGTIGYIAPEVYNKNFGGVSHKSDVYSYGMLLLEMIGGRKNVDAGVGSVRTSEIYFPDWIYNRLQQDEFLLDGVTSTDENDDARKMTIVGLWCIQPAPNQRPSINEVIEMLEGSMEALEVPPKPFFSSPPRSPATIYSTSESMLE